jgi:REP element-mobilizing transposase RayT
MKPAPSFNPWHSRGYLPHFDGSKVQFVTFRLADSVPQTVLVKWKNELENDEITDADFRKRIEMYLDQGYGSCCLKDKGIASVIRETLLKFHEVKYRLISWVIMPNHVHILIKLLEGQKLPSVMHSIKSYTAQESNRILNQRGQFWFKESFDRFIRDEKHFYSTISYIENNPVKARLCDHPSEWEFSSAYNKLGS